MGVLQVNHEWQFFFLSLGCCVSVCVWFLSFNFLLMFPHQLPWASYFFYILFIYCVVIMCVHTHVWACTSQQTCGDQDGLRESVLPSYHLRPRYWTQIVKLSSRRLHPQSRLVLLIQEFSNLERHMVPTEWGLGEMKRQLSDTNYIAGAKWTPLLPKGMVGDSE